VPVPDQLGGECGSEMSPVRVSESDLADPVLAHASLSQKTIYIVIPYPNVQWKLLMMGDCDTRNM
jgi:hypothetical protein